MKILVLGITGMLGSTVFRSFNQQLNDFEVWELLRNKEGLNHFFNSFYHQLISNKIKKCFAIHHSFHLLNKSMLGN